MGVNSGVPQKVHGARPSFVQTIFPQARQLGAAVSTGWIEPMQGQARALLSTSLCARVGFVDISRVRIADSRSERVLRAPCIGVPPGIEIFCLLEAGRGDEVRDGVFAGDGFPETCADLEGEEVRVKTLGMNGSRVARGLCCAVGVVVKENGFETVAPLRDGGCREEADMYSSSYLFFW